MIASLDILMVAAENDGIKTPKGREAKVGGIGDVVRDVPPALAALQEPDCRISIVVPSYGFLHKLDGANRIDRFRFPFAGSRKEIVLFEVPGKKPHSKVRHLVMHHPLFESRHPDSKKLTIYHNDPPKRPFATDAIKFACFCAAVAEGLKREAFGKVNRLHLHDWHAAFLLVLRLLDKSLAVLKGLRTVYTIHNLSIQGIRPLRGDPSSLEAWYPHLAFKGHEQQLMDPDYDNCLNPAAVGIRLSDAVHVVSPGYKSEILKPTIHRRFDPNAIRFGGEGLEKDLQKADQATRLFGILNGTDYDDRKMPQRDLPAYQELLKLLHSTVSGWAARSTDCVHELALKRIGLLQASAQRPEVLLTCVTRIVDQKVRLMGIPKGRSALERILEELPQNSFLILLGTGDRKLEKFLSDVSNRFARFLFLNGYDSAGADALYANGDLFLMPSSFEPCGISQMMAMRDGQPCVVHQVGGLKDTVKDEKTGFSFSGDNPNLQAKNFVLTVFRAINMMRNAPAKYEEIRQAAFRERFLWSNSIQEYVEKLYR
ncbi:MAG: glycogen/starch synthase [bacterium]